MFVQNRSFVVDVKQEKQLVIFIAYLSRFEFFLNIRFKSMLKFAYSIFLLIKKYNLK